MLEQDSVVARHERIITCVLLLMCYYSRSCDTCVHCMRTTHEDLIKRFERIVAHVYNCQVKNWIVLELILWKCSKQTDARKIYEETWQKFIRPLPNVDGCLCYTLLGVMMYNIFTISLTFTFILGRRLNGKSKEQFVSTCICLNDWCEILWYQHQAHNNGETSDIFWILRLIWGQSS